MSRKASLTQDSKYNEMVKQKRLKHEDWGHD